MSYAIFLLPTILVCALSVFVPAPVSAADYDVLFFTPASNPVQQGYVRVINHSIQSGNVAVLGTDDSGQASSGTASFFLDAGQTKHFTSKDFEQGNIGKGLTGSLGDGVGNWRLLFQTQLDIELLVYNRTPLGFLTSMHDVVGGKASTLHHVPIFNPAQNVIKVSSLRIINPGTQSVTVQITASDDAPIDSRTTGMASIVLGPNEARHLTSQDLEGGNIAAGITGAFGDGQGKWQLKVESTSPVYVLNLLKGPNWELTNLSTTPLNYPSAIGLYEGTLFSPTNGLSQIVGALTPEGRLFAYSPDFNEVFIGDYTSSGNQLSIDYSATIEGSPPYAFGTATASFSPRDWVSGSYSIGGSNGSFSLKYSTTFERAVDLDALVGDYSGEEPGGLTFNASITEEGLFSGADNQGCIYTGILLVIRPTYNLYKFVGTYICLDLVLHPWSGYAARVDNLVYGDNGALFVIAESAATNLAFELVKN